MVENHDKPVIIVMGGQWGSEGKGEVVGRLAQDIGAKGAVSVVRVGGPQAGHSVTFEDGSKISVCQIPCGFHVPHAHMYIGPGSEVDPTRLRSEMEMLDEFDVESRLAIDPRATILEQSDKDFEKNEGMTARLGSTAKGIGACRTRRLLRTARTVGDAMEIPDIYNMVNRGNPHGCYSKLNLGHHRIARRNNPYIGRTIIETAQGYGLSLTSAGYYPFCTSTDITPGRAMSDAGLSSRLDHRVMVVVRTFPIRVHGNSGPMGEEISWDEMHRISQGRSPLEGELTTVTKKVRRISKFDWSLFRAACEGCTPDYLVVTFMDYLFPELSNHTEWADIEENADAMNFINDLEDVSGSPVVAVATGPGKFAMRQPRWDALT